jgi:hypothetical protein
MAVQFKLGDYDSEVVVRRAEVSKYHLPAGI